MNTLFGLPAHPLLVHVPVVLVPLAAIAVIAMAIRPKWLRTFGPVVAAMAGIGFIGALLAAGSGEELLDSRRAAGQTISATLNDHAELGDGTQAFCGIFFVLVLLWVGFAWWRNRVGEEKAVAKVRKPKAIVAVLMVAAVLSGSAAAISIAATGHNGAKAVWESK
jgi:uncharacterized membrane protein